MAPSNIETWFEEYQKIWEAPFSLEEYLTCHTEDVLYDDLTIPKVFNGRDQLRRRWVCYRASPARTPPSSSSSARPWQTRS